MGWLKTALGLLKSGLDVFLSVFTQKNRPDVVAAKKSQQEQDDRDKTNKAIEKEDVDEIRKEI